MILHDVGPPIVYCNYNHTVSVEGDKVSLICSAINDVDAIHSLQVNWYKGNQLIPNETHVTIHNKIDKTFRQLNSTLLLDPVNRSDHGIYTFRAINHPNCSSESRINLTVQCTVDIHMYTVAGYLVYNEHILFLF